MHSVMRVWGPWAMGTGRIVVHKYTLSRGCVTQTNQTTKRRLALMRVSDHGPISGHDVRCLPSGTPIEYMQKRPMA
jgi:hypothetical protein